MWKPRQSRNEHRRIFQRGRRQADVAIAHKQNQYLILRTFIVVEIAGRGRMEGKTEGRKKGKKGTEEERKEGKGNL